MATKKLKPKVTMVLTKNPVLFEMSSTICEVCMPCVHVDIIGHLTRSLHSDGQMFRHFSWLLLEALSIAKAYRAIMRL